MGTPSFRNPFVTIAHHWSVVWGRSDGSTQPRTQRKSGISERGLASSWAPAAPGAPITNMASQSLQHFPATKHLICSRHATCSTSLVPETPLPPLLGYFFGPLSSRDSSSGDWVWLVFTTNPDTWFHWRRWDLKGGGHGSPNPFPLYSMMHWARVTDVRNVCASLLHSPLAFALSVSSWRQNALDVWVSVSASFLTPEIRILCSCRLRGGHFSRCLIKRWCGKWGFGERLPLIWFQRARKQWSCGSAL